MQKLLTDKIRVLILDDHNLFRRGIVRLLEIEPGVDVVAGSATIAEAIEALVTQPADVVLLDYDLGPERGSAFITRMREIGSDARVLVVTAGVSDRQAFELIQQGVAGIFLKADSPEMLVEAIRTVMSGESWLSQQHLKLLVNGLSELPGMEDKQFSTRERAVLRGVVEGLANKQIAGDLQISESSVKGALQQLFNKTGVRTRSQLVRVALDRYRELVL
jgi:two-component system, NarL family, nitrate/nitrite response regulator NarL